MLSTAQIESYWRNGYLVVEDVLDQTSVLDPVRREYGGILDDLYNGWFAKGLVTQAPKGMDFVQKLAHSYAQKCDWFQPMDISLPAERITEDTPMHFGPAVFDMLTNPRLLDLVADLIGPEITSTPIQHVRIKPPANTLFSDEARPHLGQTAWHQDRAVAHAEADATDMVTIWIAVTDATVDNGCLQVVPNVHDSMLPHCPMKQTSIADGYLDLDRAIPLPVKSGGVLVLDPMLPHASLVNATLGIRWSFDVRYNRTGQPTGRAHFPEFVARSLATPDSELGDWRTWKRNWETARSRIAKQPHIDLHRWDSNAPACA
ncbi:MAG: phytanoyl-CoA hydroxylase [Paracoccaceae bacterium]|jgi:phytanoyl-CoA hydroxylase